MNRIARHVAGLWRGHMPLARVFWEYAIFYGSIFNLLTTIAAFALLAGDYPAWVSLAIFFLPAPYNLLMVVSVWKSAARYAGPAYWSMLSRALILVWAAIATFA